ncbi:MAG: phospholipase/carboxylesterase [Patescibacteria group bacterium]|nr:MAG: phospholipase/carboxylesterase [Patescibacteria group bacterium]
MRENLRNIKVNGPHNNAKVIVRKSDEVQAALLLVHGRGSNAMEMLGLAELLRLPKQVMVMAVEANGQQWYPGRFLQPRVENQPYLDSALEVVGECLRILKMEYGLGAEKIVLGGFSQGACLVADYCARQPQRYGGIAVLSGGLIGEMEEIEAMHWKGDLQGTSVLVGCDERDVHIPLTWVEKTIEVMRELGGEVTGRVL